MKSEGGKAPTKTLCPFFAQDSADCARMTVSYTHLDVYKRQIQVELQSGGIRLLRGRNVVIGTGTRATLGAIPGLEAAKPLTHIEALELDELPDHLLILGGGYVGIEFAQAMRRFGCKVSIVDRSPMLLQREDPDASAALETLFLEEGIEVILKAAIDNVAGTSGDVVNVTYRQNGEVRTLQGSHLLAALGRTPNTEGLGLDHAGVEVTERCV